MFDEIAKNVMTKRKNFGAPESMMLKEMTEVKNMVGKTITIDSIIVRNKLKKDKDTGEVLKSKTGNDIYQSVVYVAYDKEYFFATKSPLIIEQLKEIVGKDIQVKEVKDIIIDNLNGEKAKIGTDKVPLGKGKDKKDYDYPIFVDA